MLDKDDDSKGSSNKISKKPSSTSDEDEDSTIGISGEDEVSEQDSAFSLFAQRKSKVKLSKNPPPPSDVELTAKAETAETAKIKSPKTETEFEAEVAETEEFEIEAPETAEANAETPAPNVTPFSPFKPKAAVNAHLAAREMPKTVEKEMPELAVAQQTVVPVPPKKELTSLYGPSRTNRPDSKEKTNTDSPAALFAKQNIQKDEDSAEGVKTGMGDISESELVEVTENMRVQKKENVVNPFSREQLDISSLNPQGLIQPVSAMELISSAAEAPKPIQASASVQALIEKLVQEMTVMTKGDKTETTLTLSNPPLFAGAQVTMTGFDSARGEVNIAFSNLTQNAQLIVQQQQQNLLATLEAKGYHVHIFTATTVVNEPIIAKAETGQANKDQRGRGEEGEGRGKQQRDNPQG